MTAWTPPGHPCYECPGAIHVPRRPTMKRPKFLEIFERHRKGAPTITGPGLGTRQLFAIVGDDPSILYNMEMQYAAPLCMGLALARPQQRFVALEGDGS